MSDDKDHGTGHIIQSLLVNVAIAAVKAVAAYFTKSGSMLAEALHSFSDCGNQILLLVGVRQARKPADEKHPFGYGRAVYFWSFMVAMMLFLGGGVFSIYEGIHKIREPEPVERVWLGVGILAVSLFLEGGACLSNIRELNKRRGKKAFMQYLKDTTDSDLVVVFGENSAAVLGLALRHRRARPRGGDRRRTLGRHRQRRDRPRARRRRRLPRHRGELTPPR